MAETFLFLLVTAGVFLFVGFIGAAVAKWYFGDDDD